jgi:integrase/recombinase XerD
MTAKLTLDTRYKSKSNLYPVVIRVRSGNQLRQVQTGYKVPKAAWNKTEIKKSYPDAAALNDDIIKKLSAVTTKLIEATRKGIEDIDIALQDENEKRKLFFSDYITARAKQYLEVKKIRHAKRILRYLLSMQQCFGKEDIPFELTTDDMRTFHTYLQRKENHTNTIADKFKKIAHLFGCAIREKKTTADNVFADYKVLKKPVHKEKLTKEEITAIEQVVLPKGSINDARNFFLFSYYCKGMRFEDCLRFKTRNIINDRLIFPEIRKGYKRITVQLHPKLKALIEPYRSNQPYLFPFLKKELMIDSGIATEAAERERISKIDSQNVTVNRNLKTVAAAAGIEKLVTMHISRHSVAYNLKKEGVNINIIQDALGHSSSDITQVYLKSLDDETIDKEINKLYE